MSRHALFAELTPVEFNIDDGYTRRHGPRAPQLELEARE